MRDNGDKAIAHVDRGLLSLAYAYALDAVREIERTDIEARVRAARPETRHEFERAVAEVRETMARAASAATETPPAALRPRILGAIDSEPEVDHPPADPTHRTVLNVDPMRPTRKRRWRVAAMAAAAALALGVGGGISQISNGGGETERVLVARDNKTATSSVIGGGTATVTYSREQNAAVVRFDGVASPATGTTYQMWLFDGPAHSAGTVTALDLAADNRRVVENIGNATAFAVTLERVGGSPVPTGNPVTTVQLES